MKRIGLIVLAVFISVALVTEVTAKDFASKASLTLAKKSRVQTFREGDSQGLPSLFSSSEGDKVYWLCGKSLFRSPLAYTFEAAPSVSRESNSKYTLAYRYLFLPPPA